MSPSAPLRRPARWLMAALLIASFLTAMAAPLLGPAPAAAAAPAASNGVVPVGPMIFALASPTIRPIGFAIDGAQAMAIAKRSPVAQAIHRREHPLQISVRAFMGRQYEVYMYFHGKLVVDVVVTKQGRLGPTWTGPLITELLGRGNYAPLFDSPWVCLPFGLLFMLPFLSLRRRPTLRELDIAAVLSFGVSYTLFNHTHFEAAVWLAYVPLVYLLVRMLIRGFRPRPDQRPLASWLPSPALAVGLVVLVIARVVLALTEITPVDVGYASVVGGYRILHGLPIYYNTLGNPDTYGPINYLAYVPFDALFGWTGKWDYLPAARAAAITFDLLTIGGLLLLGRRLRSGADGRRLGLLLAWLWAACPFSLLALTRGTNDALISLLLVGALLALSSPAARGALVGLGAAAKFVPGLLLPLVAVGLRRNGRDARVSAAAFVIVTGASFALFLPPGGAKEVWDHTLGFQLSRPDLFSIWGLHPALAPLKTLVELLSVGLAALVAVRPRGERSVPQVAALMAAILIAAQLSAMHWFYFYIVWFLPLVLVAVVAGERERRGAILLGDPEPLTPQHLNPVPALIGASQ